MSKSCKSCQMQYYCFSKEEAAIKDAFRQICLVNDFKDWQEDD
jgi:hypothetical protein